MGPTTILPICTSQVAEIIGLSRCTLPELFLLMRNVLNPIFWTLGNIVRIPN
jgi:hypothetical protein